MSAPNANSPRAGDVVVYKGAASAETYLLSIVQRASQLAFCKRDEAMRNAMAFATRDHVDAWYTEDGLAYESMARHRLQQRRRGIERCQKANKRIGNCSLGGARNRCRAGGGSPTTGSGNRP